MARWTIEFRRVLGIVDGKETGVREEQAVAAVYSVATYQYAVRELWPEMDVQWA